jgi:hypothetical protein
MTLEARVTPIWKKQKLFVSLFLIAFGAYFFYDGAVGWPRSNERFLKYQAYKNAGDLTGWSEYAKSRGWAEKPPEKIHTPTDLAGQYAFGTLATAIGLVTLGYWAQQIGRKLALDEEAVTSPAGTRVPFESITGLGLKKWDSKGLATVRYELSGRRGEFIVDDYKFDPIATREILNEVKRKLEARATGI